MRTVRPPAPRAPSLPRTIRALAFAALVTGAGFTSRDVVAKDPPPSAAAAEGKAKAEVVAEIAPYAKWCGENGAKTDGLAVVAEAEALGAAPGSGISETKTAIEAITEDAADAKDKVAAQRKIAGPKIAKAYTKLSAVEHDGKQDAMFSEWMVAALRWDPSKPQVARAQHLLDDELKGNHPEAAGKLLVAMRRADPDGAGKYDKMEVEIATKGLLWIGSPDQPLFAWLSLPKDWQKGKTYPVLVGVEGAGCGFLGYANGAKSTRGSRSVITITPCGFTNTNELKPETYPYYAPSLLKEFDGHRMDFDGPGMEAILAIVHTRFGGEEKVFVTGFSGGGNWCYHKLFTDPAHVRGASPACANFSAAPDGVAPGADGGPPVHLMTGSKDPHKDDVFGQKPGIEGQTDNAEARLKELGFTHVTRQQYPAGHDSLLGEVWKFIDETLKK
jgi:predicted esterase